MNQTELEKLLDDCPKLYHMAERDSWIGIQRDGLLSTTALLDLYEVSGDDRLEIESSRRGHTIPIASPNLPGAKIRDQLPMDDGGLRRCLPDGVSPREWYEFLNNKVFFWLSEDRLHRLSNAKAYRDGEREVLVIDAKKLVERHLDSIWFCPINSGCTKPFPCPRNFSTFCRVPDYPYEEYRAKRRKNDVVVELCVDYHVPDVLDFLIEVYVIRGDTKLANL